MIDEDLYYQALTVAEDPERFTDQEAQILREALLKGFLIDQTQRSGDHGQTNVSRQWRHWCNGLQIPFVRFLPRKRYSAVEMDLQPAGKFLPAEHFQTLEELPRKYKHSKRPKSFAFPQLFRGEVPVDKIDEVAGVLLEYACRHARSDWQ